MEKTDRLRIVSLAVNHISFKKALEQITMLALNRQPSFVCFANVHMVIEAYRSKSLLHQISKAKLILADGQPLVKACKTLYGVKQERIAGMDFMPAFLKHLNQHHLHTKVFFLGASIPILEAVIEKVKKDFFNIDIAGAISPPFRNLTRDEVNGLIETINQSGAQVVFVSLGCPKQEKWMAENYQSVHAVLMGVGGAFSVFAGLQKRAPIWMQRNSLEWLHRLIKEPGRLFKRYFYTNMIFLFLYTKAIISKVFFR